MDYVLETSTSCTGEPTRTRADPWLDTKLKLQNQQQPTTKRPFTTEKLKDPTIADALSLDLWNHVSLLEQVEDIEVLWISTKETIK